MKFFWLVLSLCSLSTASLGQISVVWAKTYGGSIFTSAPRGIAFDANANVYTLTTGRQAGFQLELVKYSANGVFLGSRAFIIGTIESGMMFESGPVAVDSLGNVWVGASRRNPNSGETSLVRSFTATLNDRTSTSRSGTVAERITALCSGPGGTMYAAGVTSAANGFTDFVLMKFDNAGNLVWTRTRDLEGGNDEPRDLDLDASGNPTITAISSGITGSSNGAVIKYDANGIFQWQATFDGSVGADGYVAGCPLGGDMVAVGYVTGTDGDKDLIVARYSPVGALLWAVRYDGGVLQRVEDCATSVAYRHGRGIVVGGWSVSGAGHDEDALALGIAEDGSSRWVHREDGGVSGPDRVSSVFLDRGGNSYITIATDRPGSGYDYALRRLSSNGLSLWSLAHGDQAVDNLLLSAAAGPNHRFALTGFTDWDPRIAVFSDPTILSDSMSITEGAIQAGSLATTFLTDSSALQIAPSTADRVSVEFAAVAPIDNISQLSFSCTGQTEGKNILISIEVWNFVQNKYDPLSTVVHLQQATTLTFNLGNPTQYLEAGTGLLRARLKWVSRDRDNRRGWSVLLDSLKWTFEPN